MTEWAQGTKKSRPKSSLPDLQARLVAAALPHVGFEGWSQAAFEHGASDAGLPATDLARAFPGGVREAFAWFSRDCDARMTAALAERDLAAMRTRERIATAVRLRLELLTPHREAMRRAATFLALPQNGPLGLRCLYHTVDDIWHAAGDRSTDFNFYSKRLLLAGVISATTLYWLDDRSDGQALTWDFLERRIDDVMQVPRVIGNVKGFANRLPDPGDLLRRFAGR